MISDVFEAVVESTEEAILNALCAGETTSGIDGRIVHAMPVDAVKDTQNLQQMMNQPCQSHSHHSLIEVSGRVIITSSGWVSTMGDAE